jgi:hypothetical protein
MPTAGFSLEFEPEKLRQLLLGLVSDHGFEIPLHSVTVGSNGSMLGMRFVPDDQDINPEVLCQHFEGTIFGLPINMLVVDSDGRTAHVRMVGANEWAMTVDSSLAASEI